MKSPTSDEPPHLGAGLSYLHTGEIKVNPEHPPLLKELAALPLVFMGTRWPLSPAQWAALGPRPDTTFQLRLGTEVLRGEDRYRVLTAARVPMLLVAALLGWTIWAWGRRMLGDAAAIGALLLLAFDPTVIAHAPLITTDVGSTAFATLFLYALWSYLGRGSTPWLLVAGLALGAALAAKFSMVFLLPLGAVLAAAGLYWTPAPTDAPSGGRREEPRWSPRLAHVVALLFGMGLVAALVVWATYLFTRDPRFYVEGLGLVNANHNPDHLPYMAGRFAKRFWSYYVVAYLLKSPIPSIVLAALGVWCVVRRGGARAIDRAFLLLPPLIFFVAYTVLSDNLGVRYIIPALPFLHLLGGAALAALFRGGRAWRVAGALLVAWLVVGAVGIYPDQLSYFNETACLLKSPRQVGLDGGSRCGAYWLDDSNVDWGGGLGQLGAWLDAHPSPLPVHLAYFGPVPPARWGVRAAAFEALILQRAPPAGRYVVSATYVARLRGAMAMERDGNDWLLHAEPTAIVGHAYYVYDVRE